MVSGLSPFLCDLIAIMITISSGLSIFQMTVEKPSPRELLWAITTGLNRAMNQSGFQAIRCHLPKARENLFVQRFDFASHCLKNWCEVLKPISKCSNHNNIALLPLMVSWKLLYFETLLFNQELAAISFQVSGTRLPNVNTQAISFQVSGTRLPNVNVQVM